MDWQRLINQFLPITYEDLTSFASPREMAQAVTTYNRALTNLKSQNGDIALIALRKLSSTYPDFALAVLLYGLSLAADEQLDKARTKIALALESGLPADYQTPAENALAHINALFEQQTTRVSGNGRSQTDRTTQTSIPGAPGVLEKTGRRGRVRMASDKERQDVIRRGEYAQTEETAVKVRRDPVEYLRIALPAVAIVIVIGLLVFFGIRLISGISETNRQNRENTDRLTWLVSRLDVLAANDPAIAGLLAEYQTAFTPQTEPEPTEAAVPTTTGSTQETTETTPPTTTAAPTAAPTTAPTTVETSLSPEVQALIDASSLFSQATAVADSDLRSAGDLLLSARTLLTGVPGTTTAPLLTGDAASLSSSVEAMIKDIGRDAAEENRQLGMQRFEVKDYSGALPYFLAGYALYPRAYGGGVAYYCGRCYQLLGDKPAAKPYFEYVIRQFPDRDIADSARSRLKEMGY